MDSSTHYFDAKTVSGWRIALESAWDDLPASEVEEGWSLSSFDPAMLLTAVDGVHLQDGIKLALYVYRWGRDGSGVTWALPTDSPVPAADDCPLTAPPAAAWTTARMADLTVPHPPSAVGDLSSVLEIDPGDAGAYLRASLLLREWGELGAANHGQWWSDQATIDTPPPPPDAPAEWEWKDQAVEDLRPHVTRTETGWQVVFYSVTAYGGWKMYAHEDLWKDGKAVAKIRLIATAAGSNKR